MSAEKSIYRALADYEKQEQTLQVEHFSNEDALALGLALVKHAKEHNFAVAVEITVNGYQMFKYGFAGATVNNDDWMRRKRNAVNAFHQSSMHLGAVQYLDKADMGKDYRLSEADYAFHGGGFPIALKDTGVIGTVCVSGLPQEQDHQMIIDVLSEFLNKQIVY